MPIFFQIPSNSSIILPFHLYSPATDSIMQPTKQNHPRPSSIQIHLKFCLLCITISKLTNKLILWNMVSLEKLSAAWDIPSWEPTSGPYSKLGASSIKFTSSFVCLWLRPTFSKPVQYNTMTRPLRWSFVLRFSDKTLHVFIFPVTTTFIWFNTSHKHISNCENTNLEILQINWTCFWLSFESTFNQKNGQEL